MTVCIPSGLRWCRVLCRKLALPLFALVVLCTPSFGDPSAFKPQQIKAAYLYKFLLLAEWPAPTAAGDSLRLVVVDSNRTMDRTLFDPITQTSLNNSSPTAKRVTVQWVDRLPDNIALRRPHIIFWADPESDIEVVLHRLREFPILTVSDSAGFLKKGGMIELRSDQDSIKFAMNKWRIDSAGLWFPSTVYRLAHTVLTKTD